MKHRKTATIHVSIRNFHDLSIDDVQADQQLNMYV